MKNRILAAVLILAALTLANPNQIKSQISQSEGYRLQQVEKLAATISAKTATSASKSKYPSIGYISGSIISKTTSILFIETNAGTKTIYTQDSTKFYQIDETSKKLIGFGDLKAGDSIIILGLTANSSSGNAKIIVRDQKQYLRNFSAMGTISEVSSSLLKLSDSTSSNLPVLSTTINTETTFTNRHKDSLKLGDFIVGSKTVVAGYFDDKGNVVTNQLFAILNTSNKTATTTAK